ncbi:peptide-N4-asparagine amidase [Streptomyces sp. NBC_00063]|uniref:peptide-N4-asparagine amidase n=1 Tax=Streptomyces sp. NBC_00063 TaxID=2975638 RepID=UPI003D73EF9B
MRRRVMSMLAAVTLAAAALVGQTTAASASAKVLPAEASTDSQPAVSQPADPPTEFGTDWHDPITATPPVAKPATRSCRVTLADTEFRDFTPYKGSYTPPKGCGDRWSKVVLRLEGKVKGRQFDRLGYLHIGGVEVLRTSTPEPSPDGIAWNVEKDVTRYSDTLRADQPVEMLIGNVVDDTYTGVIEVKATLTFYAAEPHAQRRPATDTPDRVLTLDQGTLTTPRNSERIVAEVYATGSGGGCEEFWYLAVPNEVPYSCKADGGPYREVQISVDGQLAGIASPFPNVWTGGWSNPFLWYVIPAPGAFDVRPLQYDLTPFAGLLDDGRPHQVDVSVVGVPKGQSGWSAPVNVLVWQDAGSARVTGALTGHKESEPDSSTTYTPGTDEYRLDAKGGHRLTVSGYVNTSHGRVATTVTRDLASTSTHRWTDGENNDALKGTWTDRQTVVSGHNTLRTNRTYTMDGATTLDADNRLRTVIELGDRAGAGRAMGAGRTAWTVLDDTYTGDASYTANVPRDQRHAVGTSRERYRLTSPNGCYDRELYTAQGALTVDRRRC